MNDSAGGKLREKGTSVSMEAKAHPGRDRASVANPDENPIVLHERRHGTLGRRKPHH